MPVSKYRSIADMPGETWRPAGDRDLSRAIARLWATSRRLRPRRFPPGVEKFRTIDEANQQAEKLRRL